MNTRAWLKTLVKNRLARGGTQRFKLIRFEIYDIKTSYNKIILYLRFALWKQRCKKEMIRGPKRRTNKWCFRWLQVQDAWSPHEWKVARLMNLSIFVRWSVELLIISLFFFLLANQHSEFFQQNSFYYIIIVSLHSAKVIKAGLNEWIKRHLFADM